MLHVCRVQKIDLREQDESERQAAPGFGSSDAEWADVSAFYAHWSNFVSRLSFGWADEYREQDAPSRWVVHGAKGAEGGRQAGRQEAGGSEA